MEICENTFLSFKARKKFINSFYNGNMLFCFYCANYIDLLRRRVYQNKLIRYSLIKKINLYNYLKNVKLIWNFSVNYLFQRCFYL